MKHIESELQKKAYFLTVQWMVGCEYELHTQFSTGLKGFKKDKQAFEKSFYAFTKKYSVRRTVKGEGQEATNGLLSFLMGDFIQSVEKGDSTIIDLYSEKYKNEHQEVNGILSLLSKFATLCNPTAYTMWDGNSTYSLAKIKGPKGGYQKYIDFWNDFTCYKSKFIGGLNEANTQFWWQLLIDRFAMDKNICTKEVFENRLADKYLWVYKNEI